MSVCVPSFLDFTDIFYLKKYYLLKNKNYNQKVEFKRSFLMSGSKFLTKY